ncbi:unnamed protein product [Durusdinium trenchii]|uniref:Uncharacterized protein n=1 Tax=Durusdinium trenchii TaxID=1381693 RepID=A0ABP0RA30_9DINO
MVAAQYASARLDLLDNDQPPHRNSNFMDLTHASGFALAILCLLRTVPGPGGFGCHFGIKCSSFSKMNVGTSQRSTCSSTGFSEYKSVQVGNQLLERSCCLVLLATALGGAWSVEQPSGSLLQFYPAWRETLQSIFQSGGAHAVHMVKWWMGHFGSSTPKRHYAFANSAQIHRVDMGKLEGWKSDPRIKKKSADRYRDAAGQLRYKGNENLRGTEVYPIPFARLMADLIDDHKVEMPSTPISEKETLPAKSLSTREDFKAHLIVAINKKQVELTVDEGWYSQSELVALGWSRCIKNLETALVSVDQEFDQCNEVWAKGETEGFYTEKPHALRPLSQLAMLYMFSALRKGDYTGENDGVFQNVLSAAAEEASFMSDIGLLDAQGHRYNAILLNIIGDWPFLHKSGRFARSYNNVQKRKQVRQPPGGICHQCMAGVHPVSWEQISTRRPAWKGTICQSSPFLEESPFRRVLHVPDRLELMWAWDWFHCYHLGVSKNFLGSALALLSEKEEGGTVDERFSNLSLKFQTWCITAKKRRGSTKISKELLGWQTTTVYPTGIWHKGALSTILMSFVESICERSDFSSDPFLQLVKEATMAIQACVRGLYTEQLWLKPASAGLIANEGMRFLRRYSELALEGLAYGREACARVGSGRREERMPAEKKDKKDTKRAKKEKIEKKGKKEKKRNGQNGDESDVARQKRSEEANISTRGVECPVGGDLSSMAGVTAMALWLINGRDARRPPLVYKQFPKVELRRAAGTDPESFRTVIDVISWRPLGENLWFPNPQANVQSAKPSPPSTSPVTGRVGSPVLETGFRVGQSDTTGGRDSSGFAVRCGRCEDKVPQRLGQLRGGNGRSSFMCDERLFVVSPNGQQQCGGEYVILSETANGHPVWEQRAGNFWLYSGANGMWIIGGREAKDKAFKCSHGQIFCRTSHGGVPPDQVKGVWERLHGEHFLEDSALVVMAATKVRLPPALRVVAPNGQQRSAGDYVLTETFAQGLPVWQHQNGKCYLYCGVNGSWILGGSDAKEKDFKCAKGVIYSKRTSGGLMPEKVGGVWLRLGGDQFQEDSDIAVTIKPQRLYVQTPNGQHRCAGEYVPLADRMANGYPLWEHATVGRCWLYSGSNGMWIIGGTDAAAKNFVCTRGVIYCQAVHHGQMPDKMVGNWLRLDGEKFREDAAIMVSTEPPSLHILSPNGQHRCGGEYLLISERFRGQPVWKQRRSHFRICTGSEGHWIVTNAEPKEEDAEQAVLKCEEVHGGQMPDKVTASWSRLDEKQGSMVKACFGQQFFSEQSCKWLQS